MAPHRDIKAIMLDLVKRFPGIDANVTRFRVKPARVDCVTGAGDGKDGGGKVR